MKNLIKMIVAAVAFVTGATWADEVTEAQARTVSENFITKDNVGLQILPDRSVDAVVKRDSLWLVSLKPSGYLLVGGNRWYTPYTCLDDSNSTLEKRKAAMLESLQQGCPFMVSVNTSAGGHAVVGDGWMTSTVDGSSWVHMNYGWQSTSSTTYYTHLHHRSPGDVH